MKMVMDMEEMENLKKLFITAHFIAYWNKPYSDFEKQIELIRKLGKTPSSLHKYFRPVILNVF